MARNTNGLNEVEGLVAGAIEVLHLVRASTHNPEKARRCSIAITELQNGVLWANSAFMQEEPTNG